MQSTKDESAWGHRGGGGFARLHHSLYQKKRTQQDLNLDPDEIENLSSGLFFTSSRSDSFHPSEFGDSNNNDYNMQFLRHATSSSTRGKWQKETEYYGSKEDMPVRFIVERGGVSSSPIHSNWYYALQYKLLKILISSRYT